MFWQHLVRVLRVHNFAYCKLSQQLLLLVLSWRHWIFCHQRLAKLVVHSKHPQHLLQLQNAINLFVMWNELLIGKCRKLKNEGSIKLKVRSISPTCMSWNEPLLLCKCVLLFSLQNWPPEAISAIALFWGFDYRSPKQFDGFWLQIRWKQILLFPENTQTNK